MGYKESTGGSKLDQITISSHGSSKKQLKQLNNQLRSHQFNDGGEEHFQNIPLRKQNTHRDLPEEKSRRSRLDDSPISTTSNSISKRTKSKSPKKLHTLQM